MYIAVLLAGVTLPNARVAGAQPLPAMRALASETPTAVLRGPATLLHAHAASAPLQLNLVLAVRDAAGLDARIAAASDPASPQYGHYLTQQQYLAQFAPTDAQVQTVRAWTQGAGLRVQGVSSDNLLVSVQGTTAQVQQALGVRLNDYTLHGQTFMANDRDPVLPAALPVQAISGLSSFDRVHAMLAPALRRAADTTANGYLPSDLRTAYDANAVGDGTGQTIGLTLWGAPVSQNDLNTFASQSGTPPLVSGQPGADGIDWIAVRGGSTDTHTITETAMDVEYAHGMAPHSHLKYWLSGCTYDQYAGACLPSQIGLEMMLNQAANDPTVHVVSNSWGGAEASSAGDPFVAAINVSLQHAAAVGSTFFFSTGDGGSDAGGPTQPSFPADSPYVVAVGGTTLTTTTGGYGGEAGWGGSGGGCSAVFARPAWQSGVSAASCAGRAVPDISADGDPGTGANVYVLGQAQLVGGTSLAAPLWAGMAADLNRYLAAQGQPGIGWAAPHLYQLATNPATYARDFHDVTTGSNGAFSAGTGWDEVTGWGSPDLAHLAADWASDATPTTTNTATPTSTTTTVPTDTATPTDTSTPRLTPTATRTPLPPTKTPTPTKTPAPATSTPIQPTATPTKTPASTPSSTNTPHSPTNTPMPTNTPLPPTATQTNTPPPSSTPTNTPAPTSTPLSPTRTPLSPTRTPAAAPTNTPAPALTPTAEATATATPPTSGLPPIAPPASVTPGVPATATSTPTATRIAPQKPIATPAPSSTPDATPTDTPPAQTIAPTPPPGQAPARPTSTPLAPTIAATPAPAVKSATVPPPAPPARPGSPSAPQPSNPPPPRPSPRMTPSTPTTCPNGKSLGLIPATPHRVFSGETLVITLRATSRVRLTAVLRIQAHKVVTVGSGKQRRRVTRTVTLYQAPMQMSRGRRGQVTAHLRVRYRANRPAHAMLVVTAHGGCGSMTRTIAITIEPRLRATMHAHR